MKYLKTYEWINPPVSPKLKRDDIVLTVANKIVKITQVIGLDMYRAVDLQDNESSFMLHDDSIDRKLEQHEIEALKYNL
jgi:hypothetical protein